MLIFPLSFPAHTFYPWRGVQNTYFSTLAVISSHTCNWIAVSGLSYSQNFLKTVVPFPSKGSTIIFHSISYSKFSLFAKCMSLGQKTGQARGTWLEQYKANPEAVTVPRGSSPCLCTSCSDSATGLKHVGNNEKGHNYILTQPLSAARYWWRNHCTSCNSEQSSHRLGQADPRAQRMANTQFHISEGTSPLLSNPGKDNIQVIS